MTSLFTKLRENRKYSVFWGLLFVSTALLIADLLTGDHWVTVTMANAAGYMAGNVGEHFAARKTSELA